MRRFKISGCTANFGRADLFRIVDRLAHHGYDGVEVTVMYHAPPDETSAGRRREIKNHIRQSGLAISALHFIFPPEMRMASDDRGERDRVVRHAEAVLGLASDLEAPTIMIGAPAQRSIPASVARELGLSRVLEVFTKIARKAEQTGTIACFEALNRYETNVGRTLAECASYVEQIGSANLMVGGDTFHMNIDEADMGKAVENVAHRLGHLHVEDSHRMAPGGGHIDFAPIFSALRRADYSRFLSFEMFGIAPDIPYLPIFEACDVEAAKAVERVRALESMLE
jgi:5-keto-L-gluconate epimerase